MTRVTKSLLIGGSAGILIALYFLNPTQYALMPKCMFRTLTGWSCPGCGLQRAIHAALHGDFAEAVHYNLFLLLALPYLFSLILTDWILPQGELKNDLQKVTHNRYLIYFYAFLTILWTVLRNVWGI